MMSGSKGKPRIQEDRAWINRKTFSHPSIGKRVNNLPGGVFRIHRRRD